tara:strand:+ start:7488 stop:7652 length:165 start_codon:yes stop_codon:yes gene_type:complete
MLGIKQLRDSTNHGLYRLPNKSGHVIMMPQFQVRMQGAKLLLYICWISAKIKEE